MSVLESFEHLADQLSQALLLVEPEGRVVAANAAARRRLPFEPGELSLVDRVVDPVGLRRYLTLCSGSSSRLPGILRLQEDGGEAPLRCDCSSIPPGSAQEPRYLLLHLRSRPEASHQFTFLNEQIDRLHREIRRREEAESERESLLDQERRAREEAEEASRLKDEFLATVSHELRTPLNAIKGWVHLLRSRPPDASTLARGLEIIERNTDLQTQLVEDLLDVSRIISGRIRLTVGSVDLEEVVLHAVEAVRPAVEAKSIRLQVTAESRGAVIHGDSERLVQIVWNLLSNAVKFTNKGGRVQVVLRRIRSFVEITVSDDGEGIEPDVLPYVFDRFRQADSSTTRRHGGLGLGLAIVRHLVELHGGLVSADSAGPGRGASFTVSLPIPLFEPLTRAGAASDAAHGGEAPERPGARADAPDEQALELRGLHLLLVEDHVDSLDLLSRILQKAGARVTAVRSAAGALAAIEKERPDGLVSDIEMPIEDGYALIRKLRKQERRSDAPRIPAVAVTAHAASEHRLRALRSGFQAFVAKPVHPAELLAVVASVTGRN